MKRIIKKIIGWGLALHFFPLLAFVLHDTCPLKDCDRVSLWFNHFSPYIQGWIGNIAIAAVCGFAYLVAILLYDN